MCQKLPKTAAVVVVIILSAFISIIICIEHFWNHIQEIMNHGSFWEKGSGVWDEREIYIFSLAMVLYCSIFFIMYKNIF